MVRASANCRASTWAPPAFCCFAGCATQLTSPLIRKMGTEPPQRPPLAAREILRPIQRFMQVEASGGAVLLFATVAALIWANSPWSDTYFDLWRSTIVIDTGLFRIEEDLQHWVNDALMAIFFFVVGLEIKRELVHGELREPRQAILPAAAAAGGMAVPALLYVALNAGSDGARGWGIPMATDIAFALAIMALLGDRVSTALRVFLLAVAIVDDIGAILVIAVFYSESVALDSLAVAGAFILAVFVMQRLDVRSIGAYIVIGSGLWIATFESGVHATIAGVVLGLLTPARAYLPLPAYSTKAHALLRGLQEARAEEEHGSSQSTLEELEFATAHASSPLERLERLLHPWSSYVVLPIFALANAGIELSGGIIEDAASSHVTIGIILGLVAGKLLGIVAAVALMTGLRVARLPSGADWPNIVGTALLAGVGFTVSLFITGLAFDDPTLQGDAKIGILCASLAAGVAGYLVLRFAGSKPRKQIS